MDRCGAKVEGDDWLLVLGFDPGIAILGYGLIKQDGCHLKALDYGVITTPACSDMPGRLAKLFTDVTFLIDKYKPDSVAIEEIFFSKNTKTAISISHARGVVMLAPSIAGIPVYEYTPLQVKQAITGYGRAQKQQMQQMIKLLLSLKEIPKPDDAADALAVAVCHAQSHVLNSKFIKIKEASQYV
jgi:crossover junction endodeoxyribonuclease RuvC